MGHVQQPVIETEPYLTFNSILFVMFIPRSFPYKTAGLPGINTFLIALLLLLQTYDYLAS